MLNFFPIRAPMLSHLKDILPLYFLNMLLRFRLGKYFFKYNCLRGNFKNRAITIRTSEKCTVKFVFFYFYKTNKLALTNTVLRTNWRPPGLSFLTGPSNKTFLTRYDLQSHDACRTIQNFRT